MTTGNKQEKELNKAVENFKKVFNGIENNKEKWELMHEKAFVSHKDNRVNGINLIRK